MLEYLASFILSVFNSIIYIESGVQDIALLEMLLYVHAINLINF